MSYTASYAVREPSRAELDAVPGPAVVEFGAPWCGHCARAQPAISAALGRHPTVPHLKIEDGPGRPLGRAFRIKLWPTLVFLRNGAEVGRLVRPNDVTAIEQALAGIAG